MKDTIIYHVDVNSAFLSWEAVHQLKLHPDALDLRSICSAICGDPAKRHGIILAKSSPAKAYGVETAETIGRAQSKCPSLVLVPSNYNLYVEASNNLMNLLKKYSPSVEQYSIDEAFLDMTGTYSLYGDPVDFAYKLKDKIYDTLGFTVNIGISSNHLLAKMASDFQKPNRVHTLFTEEISRKMWPLPIEDLLFVGKSTAKELHKLGIHTIGTLAQTPQEILVSHFKKQGINMYDYANGTDLHFPIIHHQKKVQKSYSHSITLANDIIEKTVAHYVLLSLCETIAAKMRFDKIRMSTISITVRYADFSTVSKQTTLSSATNQTQKIYETSISLFDSFYQEKPIRLLNVSASNADVSNNSQSSLFDDPKDERLLKLDHAIDSVRSKYGDDAIKRAIFLKTDDSM